MPARGRPAGRLHGLALGALGALSLGSGCERRGVFVLPTTPTAEALRPPRAPETTVPAALERVRTLEAACRIARRVQTQGAAARTMDRVRMVLGSLCDVETVGGDPLHWQVRCQANALFDLGAYQLRTGPEATPPCPALRGAAVDRWTCAGALLHEFVSAAGRVEVATVGHVDRVPLAAESRLDGCPGLRTALGVAPTQPWYAYAPGAPAASEAERLRGNAQLAWCRAAQTARSVRCGMTLAGRPAAPGPATTCDAVDPATLFPPEAREATTVLGAGTAWMDAQPPTACVPGPPVRGVTLPGDCPAARRVDVFVRLVPHTDPQETACPDAARDASGALSCWQGCLEHAAIDVQGERPTEVPLVAPCGPATALPPDWIRAPDPVPGPGCRSADLSTIRSTLGLP